MSMYNLVHGSNSAGPALVQLLCDIAPIDTGRYRDAWLERVGDELVIRVHTRNGGGNRPDYVAAIESMQAHPWYTRDEDDSFDCTYADFYFTIDPTHTYFSEDDDGKRLLEALVTVAIDPVDMPARWRDAIEAIRSGS